MRGLFLFLAALPAAAVISPDWGARIRVPDGIEVLRFYGRVDGTPTTDGVLVKVPLQGAAYSKVTIWPTRLKTYTTDSTTCEFLCDIAIPRHYGNLKLRAEFFNGSNVLLRTAEWITIPMSEPALLTTYTMPREIIGFEGYRQRLEMIVPAGANVSGSLRFFLYCHACTYDGKAAMRVNNAKLTVTQAGVTMLDNRPGMQYNAKLNVGQDLRYFTLPLPAGTVAVGSNEIELKFAKEEKVAGEIGWTALEFGVLRPAVTISQIVVSGDTATVTANGHGIVAGRDVHIDGFNSRRTWRVSGRQRNVTVIDANTFTFSLAAWSDGKAAGTFTYSGVTVSEFLNDLDAHAQEDPSTWTAPAGGNSTNGQTWYTAANSLVDVTYPGRETIKAACSDCHARDGRDLKYFNYSNWRNMVRSQWHGLPESKAKDITAYIRSNTSAAPGRPWIPPFQPAPCATSGSAYNWSGCAQLSDILTGDYAMGDGMFGATVEAVDFAPTRSPSDFQGMRLRMQLLGWNRWLPTIAPMDWYDSGYNAANWPFANWPTSSLKERYDQMRTNYAFNCPGAGCDAYITSDANSQRFNWESLRGNTLGQYWSQQGNNDCSTANPPNAGCESSISNKENGVARATYGVFQWTFVKSWELAHQFDLIGRSAVFFPSQGIDRGITTPTFFQGSPDLSKARIQFGPDAGKVPGIFDGSPEAENTTGRAWYHLMFLLMPTRNRPTGYDSIQPFDGPYADGKIRGNNDAMLLTQYRMIHATRYKDNYPDRTTQADRYQINTVNPGLLVSNDSWNTNWESVPAEDRTVFRGEVLSAMFSAFTDTWCGTTLNGSAPAFSLARWAVNGDGDAHYAPYTSLSGLAGYFWQALIPGIAYGVDSATQAKIRACASSWFQGPQFRLDGGINASVTTFSMKNIYTNFPEGYEFQVLIDSEKITCSSRSGSTASGCTRGADDTTAASHADNAVAQMVIRWNRSAATCTMNPDNLTVDVAACFAIKP